MSALTTLPRSLCEVPSRYLIHRVRRTRLSKAHETYSSFLGSSICEVISRQTQCAQTGVCPPGRQVMVLT